MVHASIILELDRGLSWPQYCFDCASLVTAETVINSNKKRVTVELHPTNSLVLEYINKSQNETIVNSAGAIVQDQTLEIKSVYFDQILLDSAVIQHMSQYLPRYHLGFVAHCEQNNISIDHGVQHQLKFWHNGQWSLTWSNDFWAQYQTVRRALYATDNLNLTGYTLDDIQQKLHDLKKLLNQHVK